MKKIIIIVGLVLLIGIASAIDSDHFHKPVPDKDNKKTDKYM